MLAFATACFHENEAFGTLNIIIAQGATLSMFDSKVISGAVNKFKCRENLGKLCFDSLIKRKDILE